MSYATDVELHKILEHVINVYVTLKVKNVSLAPKVAFKWQPNHL